MSFYHNFNFGCAHPVLLKYWAWITHAPIIEHLFLFVNRCIQVDTKTSVVLGAELAALQFRVQPIEPL
jgi:hypothetical protein